MIKIVNGKIVREGVVGSPSLTSSPAVPRRRCSIQDLQLKEYEQQQLQGGNGSGLFSKESFPTTQEEAPLWREVSATLLIDITLHFPLNIQEIFSQEIRVFGLHLNVLKLCIISIAFLALGGFTGLLVALIGVYLGTLFKPASSEVCSYGYIYMIYESIK